MPKNANSTSNVKYKLSADALARHVRSELECFVALGEQKNRLNIILGGY